MKRLDLAGKRFWDLTAVKDVGVDKNKNRLWLCRCICGKNTITKATELLRGRKKSCGCYQTQRVGELYGRLKVLREVERRKGLRYYLCRCECGKEIIVLGSNLIRGGTKSCGCLRHDTKPGLTHGLSKTDGGGKTRLFRIWTGINTRCFNNRVREYPRYGGRGITICAEWREFTVFHQWATDHGYRNDLTIERKDNDGNYCPENCTWIPLGLQAKNRSTTRR